MRYCIFFICVMVVIFASHQIVVAQTAVKNTSEEVVREQRNLAAAKQRNRAALARGNEIRSRANLVTREADRFALEKQAVNADINAAKANLAAARARIAIIVSRQNVQQKLLAQQTSPILRLMGALENLTRRPASLMVLQPQSLEDYIHVRAIMASVQPRIEQQTASLRGQIDLQQNLRNQQKIALKSLEAAQSELSKRQEALAQLEANSRNQAGALNADAAVEFERAIAAGERARDIVENIDNIQESEEVLAALSVLNGPKLKEDLPIIGTSEDQKLAYILPASAQIVSGFGEISKNGYRERGVSLSVPSNSAVNAPASGAVTYAGKYRNFGHIVIIEHGGGWNSLITNMASLNVSEGQQIDQGSIVGTSKSSDNDILLELRRNGRPMDILAIATK